METVRYGKKGAEPNFVLAGDIGGTKTRLALFQGAKDGYHPLVEKTYSSRDYDGLETILLDFIGEEKSIDSACFGAAGPVISGRVKTTNLPWLIETKSLRKALGSDRVAIINDLVANGYGISMLKKRDFVTLNIGKEREGNAALISAGTGLGEAILFRDGNRQMPSPSEGGHVEFGPRNQTEIELLRYLMNRFNHVSYERILSGDGLFRIYQFLRETGKFDSEPEWLAERLRQEDPAAVISRAAQSKKDPLCEKALNLFASIYGAESGNLVLKALAIGGLYVGGGIAPKIIWKLKDGSFMKAFRDKGRYSKMMADIPVRVIMNDRTALLGALSYALNRAT